MTEREQDPQPSTTVAQTPGQMLKAARQAAGVHIAALAASIKVSVQKLEALEDDRYDELPDATFARALAKTVCRALKIDPAPVLARLPEPGTPSRLEHVAMGLNQPFRDGSPRRGDRLDAGWWKRPAVWLPLLLVLAALALWIIPAGMLPSLGQWTGGGERATEAAPADGESVIPATPGTGASPAEPQTSAEPVLPPLQGATSGETVAPAATDTPASAALVGTPASNAVLVLRTSGESWVEVRDAGGRVLFSKLMRAGETAPVDGPLPMRLLIGNAGVTELTVRGQAFDLKPHVRDNVARVELR
ncbi:MAG TPA: RodZ domain-containing protein [Burkholderiaceae bacterium]|nr:RodZ domain-containing protein [Burkholderiaceae bacterium]